MSVSVVAFVWAALSLIVAASFWFSLLQPYWFVHSDTMTSLGVYSYCYHDDDDDVIDTLSPSAGRQPRQQRTPGFAERCRVYGGPRFHFSQLPSVFWQASCLLLGSASVMASVSATLAVLTVCLPRHRDSTVATVTGFIQIISGHIQ